MHPKRYPGINHLEIWVKSIPETMSFLEPIMEIVGWTKMNERSFATDRLDIYFSEHPNPPADAVGIRHICLQATDKEQVDQVGEYLRRKGADIIRGPKEMPYFDGYYTVDFKDPSGLIYEVAYTGAMPLPGDENQQLRF